MDINPLKQAWSEGRRTFNCWQVTPSTIQAEVLSNMGFDSIVVDLQHGDLGHRDLVGALTAITTGDAVPIVRVPWNEPGSIMRTLDAGARGIICPMVGNREQAERFVQACRYPPHGYRSSAPLRSHLSLGMTFPEYSKVANESVVTIALIETAEALENLDDIFSTPGLDAAYVGSSDLSLSMGGPVGVDHFREDSVEWHEQILDAGRRHGIHVGLHATKENEPEVCLDRGAAFITVTLDSEAVFNVAGAALAHAKSIVDDHSFLGTKEEAA